MCGKNWSGIARVLSVFVVCAGLLGGMALGLAQALIPAPSETIAGGIRRGERWRVSVSPDKGRKGVCLEAALQAPEDDVSAQCSAPAVIRGIVRVVYSRTDNGIKTTVVGGAFNNKVDRVEAVMVNGSPESLKLRRLHSSDSKQVRKYRYFGMATSGAWCVDKLVTRSRNGGVLWQAEAQELVPYRLEAHCSRP